MWLRTVFLWAGLVVAGSSQEVTQDPASFRGSKPKAAVPWTDTVPLLDGEWEPAWEKAAVLGPFIEVDPEEGIVTEHQSRVYLMRNRSHLFVALVAEEPEPESMVLQNMRRDAFLNDDDRFEFVFDTFHDTRTAYFFQVSAAGSRGDALLGDNGSRFNKRWDTYWDAKVKIHSDRWIAEIAIPFRALAFDSDGLWWANFERYRGSTRTRSRWAGAQRALRVGNTSAAGELTGFQDLDQGLGIEVVPYVKVRASHRENPDHRNFIGTGGGEINWNITPQLAGSFTMNTDFAETEADARRVNLSRFPLFFPEKRDFFLQDSNLFEFGPRQGFGRGGVDVLPFFSRRIGLAPSGSEVPIEAGARLAGRVEDLSLGMLAVRTEGLPGESLPDGELFVARPSYHLGSGLNVGGLFTHGNPASNKGNTVTGADVRYDSTDWLPGNFSFTAFMVRSDDDTLRDRGWAHGASATLKTSNHYFSLGTLSSQGAFEPALGFVRRPGERNHTAAADWDPRPGNGSSVRNYALRFRPSVWTDLSGEVQSYSIRMQFFGIYWHDGDEFTLNYYLTGDRLDSSFSPVSNSRIPAGEYDWQSLRAEYEFSEARPLSGEVSLQMGSWYNGHVGRFRSTVQWRPDAQLRVGLSYREDRAHLPGGDFTTRVEVLNADFTFNPDFSVENLVQADNQSDIVGLQSRWRYIQKDGRELFLVLNYAWQELPGGTIIPGSRDLTMKLVYSLRF
ncbi:MAG: hypothetical protein DWQ01_11505 [Planctomycetota bacterium]|nr:MAG: hypothetical protein DWQ01_11505 [Planctomycetota bacterium]